MLAFNGEFVSNESKGLTLLDSLQGGDGFGESPLDSLDLLHFPPLPFVETTFPVTDQSLECNGILSSAPAK